MTYGTTIAQGDTASLKNVTLLDASGAPVVLTDPVTFTQKAANGAMMLNNIPATTVDGLNGLVSFPADISSPGTFLVRWHSTFSGKPLSFPDQAPAELVVVPQ